MSSVTSRSRFFAPALLLAGLLGAVACTVSFPAVEGLGTKVRLPVFHGAMTWVNLAAFSLVALASLAFLVTKRESLYRVAEGLRWVAVPMWVTGSVLGLLAALNTWDFTGSNSSPLEVASVDPRLIAQFWVMLGALGVIALGLIIDERRLLAGVDVAFVGFLWAVLLRAILGPGRALHPDSPVMNSDEMIIKVLFFGIVASLGIATAAAAAMIVRYRASKAALRPADSEVGGEG